MTVGSNANGLPGRCSSEALSPMSAWQILQGVETLPVRMFLYIQDNIDPLVTSVSAAVIAITVLALVVLDRAYGLERLLVGRGADGR